jgi:hypothetical protein
VGGYVLPRYSAVGAHPVRSISITKEMLKIILVFIKLNPFFLLLWLFGKCPVILSGFWSPL